MTKRGSTKHVVALALVLAGFGATGARASTLVVCTEGSPDTLSGHLTGSNTGADVAEQIGDQLVRIETGTNKLIPSLATEWAVSSDGLRYTFKLRADVKWQSNKLFTPSRPMNAEDVVFSFDRMTNKDNPFYKVANGSFPLFQYLVEPSLASVNAVDPLTVEFTLKRPFAAFLNAMTMQPVQIVSKEYADVLAAKGLETRFDLQPIGTGPFALVDYQRDATIRFKAFSDFWGIAANSSRAPKVDKLVFSITPDPAVRLAKLRTNECQVARYPDLSDLDQIRSDPNLRLEESNVPSLSYLAYNTTRKPFDDKRVRIALEKAIDVDALIRAVYQGSATPAHSLIPPTLWGRAEDIVRRPFDPEAAKAELAAAGVKDLTFNLWAIPVQRAYMPNGKRAAELIQADWAKVGVKANIVSYEWGEYVRRAQAGEADVAMFGGTWDYPDPSELLEGFTCEAAKAGSNVPRWCNADYSKLLQAAGAEIDQKKRTALYQRAQHIFHDEAPFTLIADPKVYTALRSDVAGFKQHFMGGQPFGNVSLATSQ